MPDISKININGTIYDIKDVTARNDSANSGYTPSYAQGTSSNMSNVSTTAGTITQVTLTTLSHSSSSSEYSISSGGIKVTNAGTYKISGSVYLNAASGSKGCYIKVGSTFSSATETLASYVATATAGAVHIGPKIVTLEAGQIVFLAGRTSAASSFVAGNIGTYLVVEKLA